MSGKIPPVKSLDSIPEGEVCQEASPFSRAEYIACGAPAVAIIGNKKSSRPYYMCGPCANHNVTNRGGHSIFVKPGEERWVQK